MTVRMISTHKNLQVLVKVSHKSAKVIKLNPREPLSSFKQGPKNASNRIKQALHFAQDLFNKKTEHIYNKFGELTLIKELAFKDKDGITYISKAKCEKGKIISRSLYDKNTNEIKKRYIYSPNKKDTVIEEEIFENNKLAHTLSHEYDIAKAIHTVTKRDSKNNVELIRLYNLYFPDHLMKEIKP